MIGGTFEEPPEDFGLEDFVSVSLAGAASCWPASACVVALLVGVLLAAGVAWRLTAGGFVVLLAGVCACCARARAAIDAISAGSFCTTSPLPASEVAGVGPIAAPTPTPTVSIATASAALARNDGSRVRPRGGGAGAVGASLGMPAGGSEELSMSCEGLATFAGGDRVNRAIPVMLRTN